MGKMNLCCFAGLKELVTINCFVGAVKRAKATKIAEQPCAKLHYKISASSWKGRENEMRVSSFSAR